IRTASYTESPETREPRESRGNASHSWVEAPETCQESRRLTRASEAGSISWTLAADPMIGKKIGSYRVIRELGSGGMGVVYLAEHSVIGRQAAIKMLLPDLSG